jgi:hypothetical protein
VATELQSRQVVEFAFDEAELTADRVEPQLTAQLFDRLGKLRTVFDRLRQLAEVVNLEEAEGAISAYMHAVEITRRADKSDPEQLKLVVDAWLTAAREGADVTKTEADDAIVETIGSLRGKADWLVGWIARLLAAQTPGAVSTLSNDDSGEVAALGLDVGSVWAVAQLILEAIRFFSRS